MDLPDTIDGINIRSGLERVGGSPSAYLNTLKIFLRNTARTDSDLEHALNDRDFEKTTHLAHNIKGTSGNIGAEALYAIASRLEAGFKNRDWKQAGEILPKFVAELRKVQHAIVMLQQAVPEDRKTNVRMSEPGDIDAENALPALYKIRELMEQDIAEAQTRLIRLRQDAGDCAELEQIQTALDDYDTFTATERLDVFIDKLKSV